MDIRTALGHVADLAAQGVLDDPEMSDEGARQADAVRTFRDMADRHGLDIDRMVATEELMDTSGNLPEIDLDDFRGRGLDEFSAMRLTVLELACQQYRDGETDPAASAAIDLVGALFRVREDLLRDLVAEAASPTP